MVKFKGKEYQLKTLFIRDEAALAKQLQRIQSDDIEVKAEAMVKACHIMTGIDEGDLNGSKMAEISVLVREIMAERAQARELEASENDTKEAQEAGKVEPSREAAI